MSQQRKSNNCLQRGNSLVSRNCSGSTSISLLPHLRFRFVHFRFVRIVKPFVIIDFVSFFVSENNVQNTTGPLKGDLYSLSILRGKEMPRQPENYVFNGQLKRAGEDRGDLSPHPLDASCLFLDWHEDWIGLGFQEEIKPANCQCRGMAKHFNIEIFLRPLF